ncbi:HAD family hydrolase [Pseudoroseomonas deserti]|uniref:HAD family hydrolase n=1 Tax=Teichococcus deserti TaxID=1817963 RepID=A0A1V2H6X1_9PROT|nr:HAD family phosphatase [Pseudoroseomonas deserti]ONG58167.1 HAD family hydrolase [Pseudoroseomonas deserti]
MTIAAVIFDMDGLLFDSERLACQSILASMAAAGHPYTQADFLQLVGRPWSVNRAGLAERLGPAVDIEALRQDWHARYALLCEELALKPGVLALLDRLDALRLPRAICTSSSHADVARNLALHGLAPRFDAVIAAGDYPRGKPAPDPFLAAAARLGIPPERCLALEDSHNGVRAAAAAGMRTVMIPDMLPADDAMRALCHAVLPDLHAVCALLD